ncbi:MAG: DUF4157 domain-containing protein, partial [Gammaproteobacteria bacterium]|nr:DUF4157 domain-containing protein [Gammaproteobacteria bacterium]
MHSWIDASPDRQDTAVARTRASSSVAPARATAVHETAPDVGPAANAPRAGHHFANIAILAPLATNAYRPTVQTKLSVSQPDDPYEREADQVAEKVMRMPEPASSSANGADDGDGGEERLIQTKPVSSMITPLMNNTTRIFSKCVACEAEERAQGDAENNAPDQDKSNMSVEESPTQLKAVQNKRNQTDADGVAPNIENTINRRLGQGRAIPESARSFFEPRFDHDFSKVRIHDDAAANDVAHTLQAQAFTRGHDVFFRAGSYQPHTPGGRQLLAHELTHTVQQGATPPLAAHIPGAKSGDHALQSTISRTPSAQHIIHRRVATATLEGNAEQSDDVTDQVASESDNDPERGRKFTRRVVSEPADRQAPLAANMHAPLPPTQRNSTLNTPDDGNAPGPGAASAPASGRESPPPPEAAIKDASVDEASGSPAPPVKNPSPDATPGDARTTELQQASMALKSATEAALHAAPEGEAAADGQTKGTATDVEPVTEGASEVAATVAQETPTGAKGAAVAANASFETHLAEVNRLRLTPIRFMSGYMAQPGDPQDAMRRNRAMTLAKNFIGNIAQRVAGVVGATEETIARMLATLTDTQAAIDADTENETKALSVDANAARKRTRAQGAYTHKHIEAKSTAVASGAEVAAKGATARADAAHKLAKEEVDKQAKDQRKNIDNRYTLAKIETWQVGLRARSKAHARGARRSEVLLAQRNGESTVLDGPLHDNRLEARAEAAITVSNEYGKSFEASGLEQADKVADSKPEVMAKVSEISGQATTGLRDQLKQINDGIAGFEQDAKQRATNTAKQMCTATSTQVQ